MNVVTAKHDFSPTMTNRLVLTTPVDADIAELFDLHADARV
jgi:hypothetical protein